MRYRSAPRRHHPETPAISVDNDLDAIDRSAFGPHEGLFVVTQGPKSGARYALDGDTVTSRRHRVRHLPRRHHRLTSRRGAARRSRYRVCDVGSLNGTYINRDRVDEQELHEGDELQVGKFKLVFVFGTGEI